MFQVVSLNDFVVLKGWAFFAVTLKLHYSLKG